VSELAASCTEAVAWPAAAAAAAVAIVPAGETANVSVVWIDP